MGWRDFRRAVENEFGLSEAQEKATFYSTMKSAGQGDAEFILAVEAQRKLVAASDPTDNLPYIFVPRLS